MIFLLQFSDHIVHCLSCSETGTYIFTMLQFFMVSFNFRKASHIMTVLKLVRVHCLNVRILLIVASIKMD